MKLSEIAIDGAHPIHNLRLGRFADGLNFVYGERNAGKSSLRHLVRGLLFGVERNSLHRELMPGLARGHLMVRDHGGEFRLDRDLTTSDEVIVRSGSATSSQSIGSLQQLTGQINADLYDTVFSYSAIQVRDTATRLSTVLQTQLGVPRGIAAAGDDGVFQARKRASESRQANLVSLQQRIDRLNRDKQSYLNEFEKSETVRRARMAELDRQIETVSVQLTGYGVEQKRNQLAAFDREISELTILIDETVRRENLSPVAVSGPTRVGEPFGALYQRLDEIDNQIRRWRRVQTDIQTQRVRLKDEMVVWNDLTLDSNEHPYHNAREILVALEQKVDQAERQANQWGAAPAQRNDPSQLVRTIQEMCQTMRSDLYGLCQELAQQYKHIRHKAAAAELKQLRRCYNEMGENTERLVRRRESVVNEIRLVDPAGAEAIHRSEAGFCQCAMHEGYLEARRRFVSGTIISGETTTPVIRTDLSSTRRRLEALGSQRLELQRFLADADAGLIVSQSRHAQLIHERELLRHELGKRTQPFDLPRCDEELHSLNIEYQSLLRLVEEDRQFVPPPHPILVRASALLNQVTEGELSQVWIADVRDGLDFQARNRNGLVVNFSAMEPFFQEQVFFCLTIAAKESLHTRGIDVPLMIDDAFNNYSRDRITPVLELMLDLGQAGHQIILLTQHRYLADRVPGVPVFELPPSTGFDAPTIRPERSTTLPQLPVTVPEPGHYLPPVAIHDFDSADHFETDPSYPLSKYPPINDVTEYRDQTNFIVAYPGATRLDARNSTRPNQHSGPMRVAPVSVESIGDQLGFTPSVDDRTSLDRLELFELPQLRALSDLEVDTIGQLLQLDPEHLPSRLRESGITAEQLNRWQAYVWLLSNIPGLRNSDARILVACGVTEPEHLATSHGQQLLERIQRFVDSAEGQRFAANHPTISLDRINGWYRALNNTRARWQHPDGFSRQSRRQRHSYSAGLAHGQNISRESHSRPTTPRDSFATTSPSRTLPENLNREPLAKSFGERIPRSNERDVAALTREQVPFTPRPPRMRTPEPATMVTHPLPSRTVSPAIPPITRSRPATDNLRAENPEVGSEKYRFYLELKDHIEAAPSIGPKTAERFERIGVQSVADFLKQTAESMAAKLKYKRITADVVRAWQNQTRLVCRIPNLRGHDAQLLVACDLTEPEVIASMQPRQLLDVVLPFARSKDGQKIIRTGKDPDLAEVTDWINWATKTRSIQAA